MHPKANEAEKFSETRSESPTSTVDSYDRRMASPATYGTGVHPKQMKQQEFLQQDEIHLLQMLSFIKVAWQVLTHIGSKQARKHDEDRTPKP